MAKRGRPKGPQGNQRLDLFVRGARRTFASNFEIDFKLMPFKSETFIQNRDFSKNESFETLHELQSARLEAETNAINHKIERSLGVIASAIGHDKGRRAVSELHPVIIQHFSKALGKSTSALEKRLEQIELTLETVRSTQVKSDLANRVQYIETVLAADPECKALLRVCGAGPWERLTSLEALSRDLQTRLAAQSAAQDRILTLECALASSEAAVKTHNDQEQALKTRVSDLDTKRKELDTKQQELKEIRRAFQKAKQKLDERASAIGTKESELAERASAVETKESELADRTSAVETKELELAERASAVESTESELEDRVSSVDTRESDLEDSLNALATRESELEQRASALRTKESELEDILSDLTAERDDALEQVSAQNARIERRDNKIKALGGLKTEHEQAVAAHKQTVSRIEDERSTANQQVTQLTKAKDELEKSYRKSVRGLESDKQTLKEEIIDLESEIGSKNTKIDQLLANAKSANDRVTELEKIEQGQKQNINERSRQQELSKRQITELQRVTQEQSAKITALGHEVDTAKKQCAQLQSKVENQAKHIKELNDDGNAKTLHISALETSNTALNRTNDSNRGEIDRLQAMVNYQTDDLNERTLQHVTGLTSIQRLEAEIKEERATSAILRQQKTCSNFLLSMSRRRVTAVRAELLRQVDSLKRRVSSLAQSYIGLALRFSAFASRQRLARSQLIAAAKEIMSERDQQQESARLELQRQRASTGRKHQAVRSQLDAAKQSVQSLIVRKKRFARALRQSTQINKTQETTIAQQAHDSQAEIAKTKQALRQFASDHNEILARKCSQIATLSKTLRHGQRLMSVLERNNRLLRTENTRLRLTKAAQQYESEEAMFRSEREHRLVVDGLVKQHERNLDRARSEHRQEIANHAAFHERNLARFKYVCGRSSSVLRPPSLALKRLALAMGADLHTQQRELDQRDCTVSQLNTTTLRKDDELKALHTELDELKKEASTKDVKLNELNTATARKAVEVKQIRAQSDALNKSVLAGETKIDQLNTTLADRDRELSQYRNDFAVLDSDYEKLRLWAIARKEELSQANQTIRENAETIQKLRNDWTEVGEMLLIYMDGYESARLTVEKANAQRQSREDEKRKAAHDRNVKRNAEMDELRRNLDARNGTINELSRQKDAQSTTLESSRQYVAGLERKVSALGTQLQAANDNKNTLTSDLEAMRQNSISLERHQKEMDGIINEQSKSDHTHKDKLSQMQRALDSCKTELSNCQQRILAMEQCVREAKNELAEQKQTSSQDAVDLRNQLAQKETELTSTSANAAQLRQQVEELTRERDHYITENQEKTKALSQVADTHRLTEERDCYARENDEKAEAISQIRADVIDMTKRYHAGIDRLTEERDCYARENDEKAEAISQIRADVNDMVKRYHAKVFLLALERDNLSQRVGDLTQQLTMRKSLRTRR